MNASFFASGWSRRRITPQASAPGRGDAVVLGQAAGFHQHSEVQQALVQPPGQAAPAAAVQVDPDARVPRLYRLDPPGQVFDAVGLGGADVDVPAAGLPQGLAFLLRLVHHVQDFLRPFAQEHPLLRQPDAEAAADKELLPQLALQVFELLGQGRLGEAEPRRRG